MNKRDVLDEYARMPDVVIKRNRREDSFEAYFLILKSLREKNEVVINALLSCRWIIESIMTDFTTDSDGEGFITYPSCRIRRVKLRGHVYTKTGKQYEVYELILKRHASLEK